MASVSFSKPLVMNSQRSLAIDIIKLAAAFGVVIIHLEPSTKDAEVFTQLFSLFAVPFFLMISLLFFINRVNILPSPRLLSLRLDRILVPYVVWSVIYTLMRVLKYRLGGETLPINVVGIIFFGGAAVQLYFLPLLLLFQAQALSVILLFRANYWRLIGSSVALGAVLFGYFGSAGGHFGFNHALELGVLYVTLAFLLTYTQAAVNGRRTNLVIGWLIVALSVSTVFLGYPLNALGIIRGPIVGYAVAALALNWRLHITNPLLSALLTCSYGIYLAHFGFLECFEFAFDKLGADLTPYTIVTKILLGGVICLFCVGFIAIVRSHWLSAYLFLGEKANIKIQKTGAEVTANSKVLARF
jgi:peptidoglycan/LPS O-acetylase OafA/YrhL